MAVSTGVPNSRGKWTKKYSDGSNLYYSTFIEYKAGQGGRGLDPTLNNTYLLYERDRGATTEWVTAAKLSVDGKLIPLKESEAFRVTGENYNQLERIGGTSDKNILGDLAIQDLNAGGTGSLRYQTINNAKYLLSKDSGVSSEEVNRAYDISNNIKPSGSPGTPGLFGPPIAADASTASPVGSAVTAEDKEAFEEALKDLKGNSRKKYDLNLRYPENLQLEYQDCIKFSALEYKPPGLKASSGASNENRSVTLDSFKRPTIGKDGKREILGSVTLPIPGGISDGNSVGWQDDSLDPFRKAFADIAVEGITNGGEGAFKELSSQFKGARTSGLLAMVPSKFAEAVTGTNNLLQRTTGAAPNPNLELLFTGPSLRSFTFNFRLSPRSKDEAIIVRKIIRFFKQTMSVKRSTSTLLLGSPHTFAIAYLTSNKEHPYLNKFKECALQSCNVSYTPDGNYMSFNVPEPSMTSYEMSLTFKELEPIFDDDYTNLDSNNDTFIGY